jgi:putative nucleotidyltransferase with HDIG domain
MYMLKDLPSVQEAEEILTWANGQNPGPWIEHCRVAARAAGTIALKCGLDEKRAYVSGLLHDIGYYDYRDGKGTTDHIFTGYELMKKKGYETIARICLSHSFSCQDIKSFAASYINCSDDEYSFITKFLSETIYDDYDKLIQLCDSLGMPQGVVLIEKRLVDVVRRHGFNEFTLKKWDSYFELKNHFDTKCGMNIYDLFCDEIQTATFV